MPLAPSITPKKGIGMKFLIQVKQDGKWFDVSTSVATSPTSTLSGTSRLAANEVKGYVQKFLDRNLAELEAP
jgi:hypothetical protein